MLVRHHVYGLRLESNLLIPGLLALPDLDEITDVQIRLGGKPPDFAVPFSPPEKPLYRSTEIDSNGLPLLCFGQLDEKYYGFFYSDGASFAVERAGRAVWACWPENYSLEDAATYLLGPVMGFVLRLRGVLPLHASVVALGDAAIAILGPPGAGKSTTAAAFARLGHAVLSEDIAALDIREESIWVQPGYPRINLWPHSVESIFGAADALPLVTPAWGKRYIALDGPGYRFQKEPLPLAAIYFLDLREENLAETLIDSHGTAPELVVLLAHTYGSYLLDRKLRGKEFSAVARVMASVPIRYVRFPAGAAGLPGMCEAIQFDLEKLRGLSSSVVVPDVNS